MCRVSVSMCSVNLCSFLIAFDLLFVIFSLLSNALDYVFRSGNFRTLTLKCVCIYKNTHKLAISAKNFVCMACAIFIFD